MIKTKEELAAYQREYRKKQKLLKEAVGLEDKALDKKIQEYIDQGLTKDDLFTQDIRGTLALLMNVLDPSFDFSTTFSFDFPNLIPFNVRVSFAGGEDGEEFTIYGGQAVTLSVYTKVSI